MADQARVTSLDALDAFRASLIVYIEKASAGTNDVRDDVRRTRLWLEHDRRSHWEREIRKRDKMLGEAKQELMRARLSGLRDSTIVQEEGVRKAKRLLDEAEEKLRHVKRWMRDFDRCAEPLLKRLESFRQVLDFDLPKAITYLVQVQRTLGTYAETVPTLPEVTSDAAQLHSPTSLPPPSNEHTQ